MNFIVSLLLVVTFTSAARAQYQEAYTARELQVLEEFRPAVKHLLSKDYEKKDIYLIHWLRAKDLNVNEAKKMLEENMAWRQKNRVDDILDDKELNQMRKLYPSQTGQAKDKKGRPAYQAAFSQWDIRKGYLAGLNFQRYLAQRLEEVSRMAFKSGHSQWFFLVDMNQYNLRQHACLACIGFYLDLVNQYEKYYPNTANTIYLLNTPRVFEGVLQIITTVMSPHTRKVLKVFGVDKQEWQPAVLNHFDANQLTRNYGGSKI